VRRLRQLGRPGQAFAEAQYRCREILDRVDQGNLSANDWQAPHHAALLIAFTHLDIGRLDEAIVLADEAIAKVPDDAPTQEAFTWAKKRVAHWKTDAGLLARTYAWEGHHRGDPGRVITGMTRGRLTDDEDAMMLIDALVTLGRDDQAEVAYYHLRRQSTVRASSATARRASPPRRRSSSTAISPRRSNRSRSCSCAARSRASKPRSTRLYRLAAIRSAAEWDGVIARRLEIGSPRLARMAARDLADFIPQMDSPAMRTALGERTPVALDPLWVSDLIAAVPAAQGASRNDPRSPRAPEGWQLAPRRGHARARVVVRPRTARARPRRPRRRRRARRSASRSRTTSRAPRSRPRRRSPAPTATSRPRRCTSCAARATRSSRARSARS